jgi:hypothetical protein
LGKHVSYSYGNIVVVGPNNSPDVVESINLSFSSNMGYILLYRLEEKIPTFLERDLSPWGEVNEMLNIIKKVKNEEGSSTIEFLGILPLVFIVLMIMWQLIVSVQAVIVAQSAANEAAKVYSVTENSSEAEAAASKIVSAGGSYLTFQGASGMNSKDFTATVNVNIDFVFLPEKLFANNQTPSYSFSSTASGKVIKNEIEG